MMGAVLNKFRQQLKEHRRWGKIHFDINHRMIFDSAEDSLTLDAYVVSLGYIGIGDRWTLRSREWAREFCIRILTGTTEKIEYEEFLPESERLADCFMNLFNPNAKCYSNWGFITDGETTWESGTSIVFYRDFIDGGVVMMDDKWIGLLWVEDNF